MWSDASKKLPGVDHTAIFKYLDQMKKPG